jgi:hypothetical protein
MFPPYDRGCEETKSLKASTRKESNVWNYAALGAIISS